MDGVVSLDGFQILPIHQRPIKYPSLQALFLLGWSFSSRDYYIWVEQGTTQSLVRIICKLREGSSLSGPLHNQVQSNVTIVPPFFDEDENLRSQNCIFSSHFIIYMLRHNIQSVSNSSHNTYLNSIYLYLYDIIRTYNQWKFQNSIC